VYLKRASKARIHGTLYCQSPTALSSSRTCSGTLRAERASRIALREIARFLAGHELPEKVVVVTFSGRDYGVYRQAFAELEG